MADFPSISRRQVLAASGVAATGVAGYVAGVRTADSVPDWLAGRGCAPSPLPTSPTDWPFPRHDPANTSHAPARAGPEWPLDRTWEREWPVGDVLDLSPLVVADGVVVALLEAAPQSLLIAISLADGRVLWRHLAEDASYGQVCAAGGMAFVEGTVPDSSTQFTARSLGDGTALWTGTFASNVPQMLTGGHLLTVDRSPDQTRDDKHFAITAYDARTGVECWRAVHQGWPRDLVVADGQIVLPTHDHGILAVDPASGDRRWHSDVGGDRAAIVDGRMILQRFPGELKMFSLTNESLDWHVQSDHFLDGGEGDDGKQYARPGFEVGAVTPEAVVYELEVYSDYPQRLQARELDTGELLWDVGPTPTPVEFHGYSRPIVIGEDVLTVCHARREGSENPPDALLRLDVATGTERDRITFPADEHVHPPVVADSVLLVPTEERLVAFT